jgi:IclR family transcriptional regulator, acetate operon repressor
LKVVISALRLLEEIAASQPVGVSTLARSLGMPKSTVQRCLGALQTAGWITTDGSDITRWILTSRAANIATRVGAHVIDRRQALTTMRELRDATNETVHLSLLEGYRLVVLERLVGNFPLVLNYLYLEIPADSLHATAAGKAILAAMDEHALAAYLSGRTLNALTHSSIIDPDLLRGELTQVRDRGYATSVGELQDDVIAVAAAITGSHGQPLGTLSVGGPASRMTPKRTTGYGQLLITAARKLSDPYS